MNGPNTRGKPAASPQPATTQWTMSSAIGDILTEPAPGLTAPGNVDVAPPAPPQPQQMPPPAPPATPQQQQRAPVDSPPLPPQVDIGVPLDVLGEQPRQPVEAPAPDDDHSSEMDFKEPKQKNAWAKIKAEKKELQQQLKDLTSRMESNKPPEMQMVLDLQRKLEEAENKIGQLDITQTHAFKSRFDGQMQDLARQGISALVYTGKDAKEAEVLVTKILDPRHTPDEVQGMLYDLPQVVQGALLNVVVQHGQLRQTRDDAVKNWKDTRAALSQQEARDREIRLAHDVETETAAAIDRAVAAGNWMFKTGAGQDEATQKWNQGVSERISVVKGTLRTAKPVELAELVVEGLSARPLRGLYAEARTRIKKLEDELARIEGRVPRLGADSRSARAPAAPDKLRSPTDVLSSMFPGR